LGITGSFLLVLPGSITGWVGLLLLHYKKAVLMNYTFLGITFAVVIIFYTFGYNTNKYNTDE
jgi:hypothetical protein